MTGPGLATGLRAGDLRGLGNGGKGQTRSPVEPREASFLAVTPFPKSRLLRGTHGVSVDSQYRETMWLLGF